MKTDEFAFFNQQLAAMLRDGIPLEGALKRLCAEMRAGSLRDELSALEADLGRGVPIAEALAPRKLPELYKRMIVVGVKGNDLPGALTMLADYFQRQNQVWTRLRSMMTYPVIVLLVALMISAVLSGAWTWFIGPTFKGFLGGMGLKLPGFTLLVLTTLDSIWAFPAVILTILLLVLSVIFLPVVRNKIIWRLPAFREATVSRIAASIHLLLKNGVALPEAVGIAAELESSPLAVADLRGWREKLAAGTVKFSEVAASSQLIPPMFTWLISGAGENLTDGFRRASEIYQARAVYRTEVALYTVLPIATLFLGAVVISQALLVISMFLPLFAMINNLAG